MKADHRKNQLFSSVRRGSVRPSVRCSAAAALALLHVQDSVRHCFPPSTRRRAPPTHPSPLLIQPPEAIATAVRLHSGGRPPKSTAFIVLAQEATAVVRHEEGDIYGAHHGWRFKTRRLQ